MRYVIAAGAILVALGATDLVWALSYGQLGTGRVSHVLFLQTAVLLALMGYAARRFLPRASTGSWTAWRRFTVMTLLAAGALFFLVGAMESLGDRREISYRSSMRADLRNLVVAEQSFAADSGRFSSSLSDLSYTASSGTLGPVVTLTQDGWTAWVGHSGSPQTCAIFAGSTPLPPAVREGEPDCTRLPFPTRRAVRGVVFAILGLGLAAVGVWALQRSPIPGPVAGA